MVNGIITKGESILNPVLTSLRLRIRNMCSYLTIMVKINTVDCLDNRKYLTQSVKSLRRN